MKKGQQIIRFCLFGVLMLLVCFNNLANCSESVGEISGDETGLNDTGSENETKPTSDHSSGHGNMRFPIITVNWERVASPYTISVWIIFAGITKIVFHLLHKVVSRVPESCILICLGLIVGGIAYSINKDHRIDKLLFNPDTFFLFLLPPIVMEAGYFMPKEPFFENLGTILTYAIVGTIFNALAIGASLYGVYFAGLMPGIEAYGPFTILHCLLFGSIISAVDPVAVISVFEEIHVNTVLYICVFGESLLNDGVAVVLFKVFEEYIKIGQANIIPVDIVFAILSFFIVALGGLLIGLIFGYGGSFITKYTVNNRIIEPTFVFVVCYLSYLTAEIFHLSGIIAIVFAAFTMSAYVEHNISSKSHTTVKYGMKMLANIAETILFMLLGISAVSDFWQYWNTGFVLWTLVFITIYRAIGVLTLTYMVNYIRLDKINQVDQFVMAYGGLRGAIAFSLISLTSPDHVPAVNSMICACIVAILFTSFVQGSTIRPIVELLNVKKEDKHKKSMFEDVNLRLIDHLMAGVEDVTGHHGHHYWMQKLHEFNTRHLAKIFTRDPYKSRNEELLETFHRINKRDAEDLVQGFEKGNSYNELHANGTFANFLIPEELKRSYSQVSFSNMIRQQGPSEACIDMHAFEAPAKDKDDVAIHHLLEQNMYMPRTRESTRYRRGNIDDDSERKQQETEIFLRHKITLRRRPKHFKHKHNKHRNRAGSRNISPLAVGSKSSLKASGTASNLESERRPLLSAPSLTVHPPPPDENQSLKTTKREPADEGITFTAGPKKEVENEEIEMTQLDSVALDRQLPWKRVEPTEAAVSDPQSSTEAEETEVNSAALQLPWKRSGQSEAAVSDPHNRAESSSAREVDSFGNMELWPGASNKEDDLGGETDQSVVIKMPSLNDNDLKDLKEDNV